MPILCGICRHPVLDLFFSNSQYGDRFRGGVLRTPPPFQSESGEFWLLMHERAEVANKHLSEFMKFRTEYISAEETAWNVFNKSELEAWILLFQISYACLNKSPQVSRNVPIFETDRVTLTKNIIKAAFSSFEHFPHLVSCWKVAWFNLNFLPPKKSSSCPVNYVKRTEIPTPEEEKI